MIDLHTHTFLSDGALVPTELIRRAFCKGYRYLAITDHADCTNLGPAIAAAAKAAESVRGRWPITVLPGVELTHLPPEIIPETIREARDLGAKVVIVHGETVVEPVAEGTNRMAIAGGADILSHPGLISAKDVRKAAKKGVRLELTTRAGHSLANGHVARLAEREGAEMILGTDSHGPADLKTREEAETIARAAGLSAAAVRKIFRNAESFARRLDQNR